MFNNKKSLVVLGTMLLIALTAGPVLSQEGKLTRRLQSFLAAPEKAATDNGTIAVWVKFIDKDLPGSALEQALVLAEENLVPATRERRAKGSLQNPLVSEADLPLAGRYLETVAATGAVARQQSRWLNAASYDVSRDQLAAMAALSCVAKLDLVGRGLGNRSKPVAEAPAEMPTDLAAGKSFTNLEYGPSRHGLEQINVTAAHAKGLSGHGVTIAVFSTGFNLEHDCLQNLDVVGAWDFVDDDPYVFYQPARGDNIEQDLYGTASLSALAGFSPNNIIGVAYGASVIVAKTEDLDRETEAEEDNWIAALEWAEGLGADIVSSGLGYIDWYDFSDLDGNTASITIAAEMASARGVCVVNSVGDMRGSSTWPGIIPPSDGRSVIGVGSVDLNNQITSFSSPGPTTDGRIKPDVLALGGGTLVAFDFVDDMYLYGYGTNYAVPLVAGVVALMLEQDPNLNPTQVARALRQTASRSLLPDNDFGWGVIDAMSALNYWSPSISHTPLSDQEGNTGVFTIAATITSGVDLDPGRVMVFWREFGEAWEVLPMVAGADDVYTTLMPPRGPNKVMEYYISATDMDGHSARIPAGAPDSVFTFRVGPDTIAPVVRHTNLADQLPGQWPPKITLEATDNQGMGEVALQFSFMGGAWEGPFPMTLVDGHYELDLPYTGPIMAGMWFSYLIVAKDVAAVPNMGIAGPFEFKIVDAKGSILLVDDRRNTKAALDSERAQGAVAEDPDKGVSELATWITEAGFTVDIIQGDAVGSASFQGYDAVMVTTGSNFAPLAYQELRRTMVSWADQGGKILVEGGETAYTVLVTPGYPAVAESVLHAASYVGEDGAKLYAPQELVDHPLVNRPHALESPLVIDNMGGNDWGAADLVRAADDAIVSMHAAYGERMGGVVAYDDNTGPDAGQTVYFPFDILKTTEGGGPLLLDNALTYLLFTEPPGPSSISGQVTLAARTDNSGATVRMGMSHSTVTAADGSFTLDGLWGGQFDLVVEADGFAPQFRSVDLVENVDLVLDGLYLMPAVAVVQSASPGAEIPDNNPTGVTSVVEIDQAGELVGISIDCDIKHYAIGQLEVTLTDPHGTTVTLHNLTGGTIDDLVGNWPANLFVDGPGDLPDFLGRDPQGSWTLKVVDNYLGATGTLNSWALRLLVTPRNAAPVGAAPLLATRLIGNFPNPFNPRTTIDFELKQAGRARVDVYDVRGSLVRRLTDGILPAGRHQVVWDGKDSGGHEPASGLYFCRLRTQEKTQVIKMTLVR